MAWPMGEGKGASWRRIFPSRRRRSPAGFPAGLLSLAFSVKGRSEGKFPCLKRDLRTVLSLHCFTSQRLHAGRSSLVGARVLSRRLGPHRAAQGPTRASSESLQILKDITACFSGAETCQQFPMSTQCLPTSTPCAARLCGLLVFQFLPICLPECLPGVIFYSEITLIFNNFRYLLFKC